MCMKVNEGEWREMNVYALMQISIGQRVTALRLGAINHPTKGDVTSA